MSGRDEADRCQQGIGGGAVCRTHNEGHVDDVVGQTVKPAGKCALWRRPGQAGVDRHAVLGWPRSTGRDCAGPTGPRSGTFTLARTESGHQCVSDVGVVGHVEQSKPKPTSSQPGRAPARTSCVLIALATDSYDVPGGASPAHCVARRRRSCAVSSRHPGRSCDRCAARSLRSGRRRGRGPGRRPR